MALSIFMPFSQWLFYSNILLLSDLSVRILGWVVFCVRHLLTYTLLGSFHNNLCFEKKKEKSFGANQGSNLVSTLLFSNESLSAFVLSIYYSSLQSASLSLR